MHRVFVVEDHDLMREMLVDFLAASLDVEICGSAASVDEALDAMESARPTLLVADVSLPDRSGFDLVAEVRRRWPLVICLVLTGHHEAIYRERALASGAHGFVVKGDPTELLDVIAQLPPPVAPVG